jgi:hypothetical protein
MKKTVILCIAIVLTSINTNAQNRSAPAPLSQQDKKQTIEIVIKQLDEQYIYPAIAEKMNKALTTNLKKGVYNAITNPMEFADKLTADLVMTSNDRHFRVQFEPERIQQSKRAMTKKDTLEIENQEFLSLKKENFGFKELKILEGNIGYINLIGFSPTSYSGETAVAALNFLRNTNAIILDLRTNGGGSPDMVQLIASYFFDATQMKLVEFYTRKGNETTQDFNLQYLPSQRMPTKELYILTSQQTFSAAESFSYIMKNRKRATIIGEATGGGAHPVAPVVLNDLFMMRIPVAKPIDPITKTDWEGTGVKPDIEVAAKDALITAQIKAIEKMAATTTEDNAEYVWQLDGLKAQQNPPKIDIQVLKTYLGKYGPRKVFFENEILYFQREGQEKRKLLPISQVLFLLENVDDVRVEMVIENGKVTALKRIYIDGNSGMDRKEE